MAKECPVCGKQTYSPRAIYCSSDGRCRAKAYRMRMRDASVTNNSSQIAQMVEDAVNKAVQAALASFSPAPVAAAPVGNLSNLKEVSAPEIEVDNLLGLFEMEADKSIDSSANFRQAMMKMQLGQGAWAS